MISKHNLNHHQTNYRPTIDQQSTHHRKGSILIWTLLLGFVLTSVFFFFAMRQRATVAAQRDTAAILNARTFVESYADYLEKNPSEMDKKLFDGIHVNLTKKVDKIEGAADFDPTGSGITYNFSGNIFVEWNKCGDTLKGDLKINDALYEKKGSGCGNKEYEDIIGPISLTAASFDIKTMNAPFRYRITAKDSSTILADNLWHMDLVMDLEYGRKVEVKRTF